jgi:hypothetical protein
MSKNLKALDAILNSAKNGDVQSIKEFISKKKNLNVQGPDGRTALINAAANHHGSIVELLLDSGADVMVATNSGKTVLNYALCSAFGFSIGGRRGESSAFEIVSLLLGRNCAITSHDISFAILFHESKVLSTLLKRVSQNRKLLTDGIRYASENAFEFDCDESVFEQNLEIARVYLKRV